VKLAEWFLFTLAASLYRVSRWYKRAADECYLRGSILWGQRYRR
jgi:hypothetical protein